MKVKIDKVSSEYKTWYTVSYKLFNDLSMWMPLEVMPGECKLGTLEEAEQKAAIFIKNYKENAVKSVETIKRFEA